MLHLFSRNDIRSTSYSIQMKGQILQPMTQLSMNTLNGLRWKVMVMFISLMNLIQEPLGEVHWMTLRSHVLLNRCMGTETPSRLVLEEEGHTTSKLLSVRVE